MKYEMRPRPVVAAVAALLICVGSAIMPAQSAVLSEMSPSSGNAGTVVIITGDNFGTKKGASTVTIGGMPAVIRQWSDNRLAVAVPAGVAAGPAEVVVTIANVKEDYPGTFAVTLAGAMDSQSGAVAARQPASPPVMPAVVPRTSRASARKLTVALTDSPEGRAAEKEPVRVAAAPRATLYHAATVGRPGADPPATATVAKPAAGLPASEQPVPPPPSRDPDSETTRMESRP